MEGLTKGGSERNCRALNSMGPGASPLIFFSFTSLASLFLFFFFIMEYSLFTTSCQFQTYSKVIQSYVYLFSFRFFSHIQVITPFLSIINFIKLCPNTEVQHHDKNDNKNDNYSNNLNPCKVHYVYSLVVFLLGGK